MFRGFITLVYTNIYKYIPKVNRLCKFFFLKFFFLVDFSGRFWRSFGLRVPVAGSSPPRLLASRTSTRGRGRSGPRLRRSAAPESSTAPAALPLGPGGTVRERSPCEQHETGTRAALARACINILFGVREPERGEPGKFGRTSGAGAGHACAVRVELRRSRVSLTRPAQAVASTSPEKFIRRGGDEKRRARRAPEKGNGRSCASPGVVRSSGPPTTAPPTPQGAQGVAPRVIEWPVAGRPLKTCFPCLCTSR